MGRFAKIIVHPGGAHRDDFVSVCIALAVYGQDTEVIRREPTPEELEDVRVLVLDVGGRYEPDLGNYDHHQLPRDAEPACALSLFAEEIGLELDVHAWFEVTKILDSKGPVSSAQHLGISMGSQEQAFSPVEFALFKCWEEGGDLREVMFRIGETIIAETHAVVEDLEYLRNTGTTVQVAPGCHGLVMRKRCLTRVINIRRAEIEKELGEALAFSIMPDDRGPGWALFRFDDHPSLDFFQLDGNPAVMFAHKGGFIAKTKEITEESVIKLVEGSVVK